MPLEKEVYFGELPPGWVLPRWASWYAFLLRWVVVSDGLAGRELVECALESNAKTEDFADQRVAAIDA